MTDSEIISLFFDRDERAIEHVCEKYSAYCRSIIIRILKNEDDCAECLNDTWLGAWNTIPPNRPEKLAVYLGKLAKRISVSRLRAINAKKRGGGRLTLLLSELSEAAPDFVTPEAVLEQRELTELIQSFVNGLSDTNRGLFICRYYFLDRTGDIARRFGLSENQVSVRLTRIRKKLKKFLEKEGVTVD